MTKIRFLPNSPRLVSIGCDGTRISYVRNYPILRYLSANRCSKLVRIAATGLHVCSCSMTGITRLPDMPRINQLNVSWTKIREIGNLPVMTRLDCSYCHELTELSNLFVEDIRCFYSRRLKRITNCVTDYILADSCMNLESFDSGRIFQFGQFNGCSSLTYVDSAHHLSVNGSWIEHLSNAGYVDKVVAGLKINAWANRCLLARKIRKYHAELVPIWYGPPSGVGYLRHVKQIYEMENMLTGG